MAVVSAVDNRLLALLLLLLLLLLLFYFFVWIFRVGKRKEDSRIELYSRSILQWLSVRSFLTWVMPRVVDDIQLNLLRRRWNRQFYRSRLVLNAFPLGEESFDGKFMVTEKKIL